MATASISGAVRDQDGHPLAWASIQISPPEGYEPTSGIEPARLWAYGQTDSTGTFRVDRLPAGTYAVHATYSTGYITDRRGMTAPTPHRPPHLLFWPRGKPAPAST